MIPYLKARIKVVFILIVVGFPGAKHIQMKDMSFTEIGQFIHSNLTSARAQQFLKETISILFCYVHHSFCTVSIKTEHISMKGELVAALEERSGNARKKADD